jgi:hypothetical protein
MSEAERQTTVVASDTQIWICKVIHIQTDISIGSSQYKTAENWVTTLKLE